MTITGGTTSTDLATTVRRVHNVNVTDTTASPGANAWVILRDGGSAGTQVLNIRVPAGDSKTIPFPADRPLPFPNGLYVTVAGGAVRWSIDGT